jgi:hypothetical protein
MSFNEIDRKLLNGVYASFSDFGADVQQVFANCHHFNSEDTLIYKDASALQLAYREAVLAVPFADMVPEASIYSTSAKTLAANELEPGTLAAPLLPTGGGAVDDTHTARRASRAADDVTGNEQSAPHAKVYANASSKEMTADVKRKKTAKLAAKRKAGKDASPRAAQRARLVPGGNAERLTRAELEALVVAASSPSTVVCQRCLHPGRKRAHTCSPNSSKGGIAAFEKKPLQIKSAKETRGKSKQPIK